MLQSRQQSSAQQELFPSFDLRTWLGRASQSHLLHYTHHHTKLFDRLPAIASPAHAQESTFQQRSRVYPTDPCLAIMRITPLVLSAFLAFDLGIVAAFSQSRHTHSCGAAAHSATSTRTPALNAIGLGPGEDEQASAAAIAEQPAAPTVEIDNEQYRTSRLTKIDEQCDEWYGALLGTSDETTFLGDVSAEARKRILTLPELKRAVSEEF